MSGFNSFRNRFPYTNINDINLDWIIKRVKALSEAVAAIDISRMDEIAQQAETAQQDAETALATANSVQGIANNALSTAQSAETTAQSAETTANSVQGIANNAQTTADNAINGVNALRASKANKVENATSGNFAGLNANGDLTDSGHNNNDYAISGLGISGASVGEFVKIAAIDANGKPTDFDTGAAGGGDVTADMLGIVINGNSTPVGAAVGQYVIVKNSTISGITDGVYTAALSIPANTAIDATYLTAVSGGGLNAIASITPMTTFFNDGHRTMKYFTKPSLKIAFVYCSSDDQTVTDRDFIDYQGTLPASIRPVFGGSVVTRKFGFITVNSSGEVIFRLMKNQIWDQGFIVLPYL